MSRCFIFFLTAVALLAVDTTARAQSDAGFVPIAVVPVAAGATAATISLATPTQSYLAVRLAAPAGRFDVARVAVTFRDGGTSALATWRVSR